MDWIVYPLVIKEEMSYKPFKKHSEEEEEEEEEEGSSSKNTERKRERGRRRKRSRISVLERPRRRELCKI